MRISSTWFSWCKLGGTTLGSISLAAEYFFMDCLTHIWCKHKGLDHHLNIWVLGLIYGRLCTNVGPIDSASPGRTSSLAGSKAVDQTLIVNHSSLFMQLVVLHHCSGLLLVLLWRRFSFILKPLLCSGVSLNHCCWACCCQLSSLYSLCFDVSLYGCYWVIIWNSMLIFYPLLVLLVWYKIRSDKHCNSPVALAYHSNEGRAIALHVCSLQRTDKKSCWCKTFLVESSH